ncbi:hypothetical protein L9F63_023821, partial [Diploptera punctata]
NRTRVAGVEGLQPLPDSHEDFRESSRYGNIESELSHSSTSCFRMSPSSVLNGQYEWTPVSQ